MRLRIIIGFFDRWPNWNPLLNQTRTLIGLNRVGLVSSWFFNEPNPFTLGFTNRTENIKQETSRCLIESIEFYAGSTRSFFLLQEAKRSVCSSGSDVERRRLIFTSLPLLFRLNESASEPTKRKNSEPSISVPEVQQTW